MSTVALAATPTIELMIRAAVEFDDAHYNSCKLVGFNPKTRNLSPLSILFVLGRIFGPGITKAQFRQIVRKCIVCNNICFVERLHLHQCYGTVLRTMADGFDFEAIMLSNKEHAGFSRFDIYRLLELCADCGHICMEGAVSLHNCSAE